VVASHCALAQCARGKDGRDYIGRTTR
jgi:hypothetical protein